MKEKQAIQLSDKFSYGRLIRFVIPSVCMMVFTSIYGIVDGFFVSNFVNPDAFAAVNIIMPLLMILGAVGFMIGAGGTAIVAKTFGLGERELANRYFSFLVYFTVVSGIVFAVLGIAFARPAARLLGATGDTLEYCVIYARIILLALPFFMLQNVFQSFFITAEKPKLGLYVTVLAGVTNIILDALLVAAFEWGLAGAAIATAMSQLVGGVIPLIYFGRRNTSTLRLGKTEFYGKTLLHTCTNGSSELLSNISSSIVTILYNAQLMRYAEGNSGVIAYGAIMYISYIFAAIFIGFSIGTAPIVSYNFGAGNKEELKSIYKKSLVIIGVTSVLMTLSSLLLASPFTRLYLEDEALYEITLHGFKIFSFVFLTMGLNIFGSSFFTALNNGVISAVISFLRTIVFQIAAVLILPIFWQLDGIWFSVIAADALAIVVTLAFLIGKKKHYGY